MKFHAPYHFIPYDDGKDAGRADTARETFKDPARCPPELTHDRYVPGTFSGRIRCKLTTVTPVVAGGSQAPGRDGVTEVQNYRLGDRLAIPASSLRGMISNIAEAASNSAMRVLETDKNYSRRKTMHDEKKLSALAMVVQNGYRFLLWPLAVPTMEVNSKGMAALPKGYERFFPAPALKVYLGCRSSIRQEDYAYRSYKYGGDNQFFQFPLVARKWSRAFELPVDGDPLLHAKPEARPRYVIGQKVAVAEAPASPLTWGVMRVLGCWPASRQAIMPNTKKHELFVPVPSDPAWPQIEIPPAVIDQFHALCDERTAATQDRYRRKPQKNPLLPMEPLDTRPERYDPATDDLRIRLKHGDIVYFGADQKGNIAEISFSSIWRASVPNGNGGMARARDFFPPRLRPFDWLKTELTPADLLMGFVEAGEPQKEGKKPDSGKPQTLAMASRVRFTAALPEEGKPLKLLPKVRRKILDSPKLPSPALYFREKVGPGGYVSKDKLNCQSHKAQGRKMYLHHALAPGDAPWKTKLPKENVDQKADIEPIDAGQHLFFEVSFDNLSEKEYGLLLFALSPDDNFQHKIGMGKAIGLGSVKLAIEGVWSVNRQARYAKDGLDTPRETLEPGWKQALAASREAVPKPVSNALRLLGQAPHKLPVLQPALEGQDQEHETFRWFVANDNPDGWKDNYTEVPQMKQYLTPLDKAAELPSLEGKALQPRQTR